ncbi:PAS domain S-box protein, partial [Myxococcus vastator]|uniref:PAS domain S-box protein n=1 Tax=Myxococcus vastator TaxID=2709664 RepID=UPI0013D4F62A
MSTKRYSEAELRVLTDTFRNPMLAVVEGRVLVANDAYVALLGLRRAQVEGRSVMDFIQREDRSRVVERYWRVEAGAPLHEGSQLFQVPCADGVAREVAVTASRFVLESGGGGLLLNCVPMENRPPEMSVAERLVETSAGLVSAHSENAVRRVALKGLEAAGFRARLLRWDGEGLLTRDGAPLPEDARLGLESLADGRPVFGGVDQASPTHVYLPVGGPQAEVLWVEGHWVAPRHGSVLMLFAKVVGAALTDARVQAESARSRWEMEAVAQMARFVAQPAPPTQEDFLERVASLLQADAAALHLSTPPEVPLSLSSHVGLQDVADARRLTGVLSCGAEGALTSAADESSLAEQSGGRLG